MSWRQEQVVRVNITAVATNLTSWTALPACSEAHVCLGPSAALMSIPEPVGRRHSTLSTDSGVTQSRSDLAPLGCRERCHVA